MTPFKGSYWVREGRLLAGEYPGSKDPGEARIKLQRLFDCGIRHIVNLMAPDERDRAGSRFIPYAEMLADIAEKAGGAVTVARHPIPDLDTPSRSEMRAILADIDRAVAEPRPVYVHCLAGIGRTGTVVGCYLMAHGMASPETVLDRIRQLRGADANPHIPVPETPRQRNFVLSWPMGSENSDL